MQPHFVLHRCPHVPPLPAQWPIWLHGCSGVGHIWPGRCGCTRGGHHQLCVSASLSALSPCCGSQSTLVCHRGSWEGCGCPLLLWGWGGGGSSVHGAQASPELVRACFLLVVLSCEGGRTIWSSPCQPNKIRNAGQALQILLTAAGQCGAVSGQGLTHLSPYTEPGVMAEEPRFLLGAAGLGQSAWAGVP